MGYEVLGTLGYGARSTIYQVRDSEKKIFALKHVVRRVPTDQRFLDQAICEHEVASRFRYPSLRRSYKVIRQRRFIRTTEISVIMELVDGESLEQHPIDDMMVVCGLIQQVSSGLHEMHTAGYVHADIKPNNIMVNAAKQVKIIDFGQSCPSGTVKERIQGTPDYIAPEQVLRRRITAQTDVFNLGATLYWLLTRKHVPTMIPKSDSGMEIRHSASVPHPRELNPKVPPALSSLIMNCVEKKPDNRPESMIIFQERLDLAISQIPKEGGDASQGPAASTPTAPPGRPL